MVVAAEFAAELGRAVRAAVLEHVDRAVLGACHDDRRRADIGADEVAGFRHFRLERNVVPGAAVKDSLDLALVDTLVGINPIGNFGQVVIWPHALYKRDRRVEIHGQFLDRAGTNFGFLGRQNHRIGSRQISRLWRFRRRGRCCIVGEIDQDIVAVTLYGVNSQILRHGQAKRLTRADVELALMQRAFNLAVFDPAIRQKGQSMRANSMSGENLIA